MSIASTLLAVIGSLVIIAMATASADDTGAEECEEQETDKVIIPALPGFYALEITPDELAAAANADDVLGAFLRWPIIAWEMDGDVAYSPPLAITTAGTEQDHTAILWPDGRVHDQGDEVYKDAFAFASHLLAEREKRKMTA